MEQHFTFFHLVFLVSGKSATVDHVVEGDVGDLFEAAGGHVEADGSIQEEGAELEEGVEGESRHVWLAPTIASLLHVFLKLDPSKKDQIQLVKILVDNLAVSFHSMLPSSPT